jgi:hypothetical protein
LLVFFHGKERGMVRAARQALTRRRSASGRALALSHKH